MTDTAPLKLDLQDPLPEANWFWRRVFVFLLVTGMCLLVFRSVERLGAVALVRPEVGIPAFVDIVKFLIVTLNLAMLYYMVAPSAEQITKMLQTARLLKAGVQMASRVVETPDRREVAATVARPPQPAVPPVVDEPAPPVGENPDGEAPPAPETGPWGTEVADDPAGPPAGVSGAPDDMPNIQAKG